MPVLYTRLISPFHSPWNCARSRSAPVTPLSTMASSGARNFSSLYPRPTKPLRDSASTYATAHRRVSACEQGPQHRLAATWVLPLRGCKLAALSLTHLSRSAKRAKQNNGGRATPQSPVPKRGRANPHRVHRIMLTPYHNDAAPKQRRGNKREQSRAGRNRKHAASIAEQRRTCLARSCRVPPRKGVCSAVRGTSARR